MLPDTSTAPDKVEVLRLENISKQFAEHQVLKAISLKANRGDVIALLGQSGSGKSTLLRCTNLLTVPDAGNIFLHNEKILFTPKQSKDVAVTEQVNKLRCQVAMVFQQFNLWLHRTAIENIVEAPIHVLQLSKKEAYERAEYLLAKVGMTKKRDQYPTQLSGGQQQRIAIARALAMQPEVILFDEPTSSLDPEMVGEVLGVMRNLADEGITMLVATHEMGFAKEVASHAVFLDNGILVEQGAAREIFAHPQTERFAAFITSAFD